MKFCPECGVQLPEKAKFCPDCGQALSIDVSQNANPPQATPQTTSEEDEQAEARANKKQFYVSKNNQRLGPYSTRDIQARLVDGSIAPTDLMWRERMSEWQPVCAFIDTLEVEKILEHAGEIHPKDDQDTTAWNEKAGELALAIKKSKGFCPNAHVQLGWCLINTGFPDRAKQEFKTALSQDKYNIEAHAFLLLFAMDELGLPRGLPQNTGSLTVDLVSLFIGGGVAQGKLMKFSKMIDALIEALPRDLSGSDKVGYWLRMSDIVFSVHDEIQSIKGLVGKDRLVRAVIGLPWKGLDLTPEEQKDVDEVIHKAERRLALAA